MNKDMDLRVERCLQLLGNLKQTAARFAKRENLLNRELGGRRHSITQAAQEAIATKEATHSTQIAQAEAYFREEAQRIRKIYEARQNRTNHYSSTRLRNLPRLAQEMKGEWQGNLQMRNYQAQRKMAADIAAADADYAGFSTKLETHWKNLLSLEKRAGASFRGYLSFLFMMGRKRPLQFTEDSSLTQILKDVDERLEMADRQLYEFENLALPRFFGFALLPILFLLSAGVVGALFWQMGVNSTTYTAAAITGGIFAAIWIVHTIGWVQGRPRARVVARALVEARQIIQGGLAAGPVMGAKREHIRQEIEKEY